MKKKLMIIVSAMVVCVSLLAFTACNKKETEKENGNISRIVNAYFVGESDNFLITIEKGEREKNFVADGVATDVQSFSEMIITPQKVIDVESVEYTIKGENAEIKGTSTTNKFGEYKMDVSALDFEPLSVTISVGETAEDIMLFDVLKDKLTALDVINIAEREFEERILQEQADGQTREVYVKLISAD
ncbi:MAG: hypothetical protein MJ193_00925, partial [Clostridia bacterium]|nr:hypothetical protein [Clostridia bacterium]